MHTDQLYGLERHIKNIRLKEVFSWVCRHSCKMGILSSIFEEKWS